MTHSKKITINAVSFIDLQLKLMKHPHWRILEISRLNFGFKINFQKTAKEQRRHLSDAVIHLPTERRNSIGHRSSSSLPKNISQSNIHEDFL
jgi:hypothetical protein